MRKLFLALVSLAAVAAPVVAVSLRWRDARTAQTALRDGRALLHAPLEQTTGLESIDVARAQTLLEQARHGHPEGDLGREARALWHVAQAYGDLSRGDLALATQEADTASEMDPSNADAALVQATVALRRGDRARAEHLLDALEANRGADPSVRARAALARLELLMDTHRTQDALTAAEMLDHDHPRVAVVKNLLGLARAAAGDGTGARDAFTHAAQLDLRDETPWVNLARLARERGDLGEARTALERALGIAPDSAEGWLAYGVVLAESHDPAAHHTLVHAGELAPDDAAPWAAQGNLDLSEGNFDGAVDSFRNALARNADDVTAQSNLGIALARLGRRTEAATAFDEATRRAPHLGEAWNGLGAMRLANGNALDALGALQQACVLLPTDPNPALNLGRAFESLQRWDEAAHAFREALRRAPGNPTALDHLTQLAPSTHTRRAQGAPRHSAVRG